MLFSLFLGFVKKLALFLGTKTLLSMMTFQNYNLLGNHLKRVYGNTDQPVEPCAQQQNRRNLAHFRFSKEQLLIFPSMLHITYQKTGVILNALILTGFQTKMAVKTRSPTLYTFLFLVDKEFVLERISQVSMLPL